MTPVFAKPKFARALFSKGVVFKRRCIQEENLKEVKKHLI